MKYFKEAIFITAAILILASSQAHAKKGKVKKNTQTLNFKGMDVSSPKGSPRSHLTSTADKSDFEYFFDTKVDFRKEVINSLESVR